jgi:hypothetical protein
MAKKKVFALRVDEELFAAVERWAADEFRSTNGQLEWVISRALREAGRLVKKKSLNDEKNDLPVK